MLYFVICIAQSCYEKIFGSLAAYFSKESTILLPLWIFVFLLEKILNEQVYGVPLCPHSMVLHSNYWIFQPKHLMKVT